MLLRGYSLHISLRKFGPLSEIAFVRAAMGRIGFRVSSTTKRARGEYLKSGGGDLKKGSAHIRC